MFGGMSDHTNVYISHRGEDGQIHPRTALAHSEPAPDDATMITPLKGRTGTS